MTPAVNPPIAGADGCKGGWVFICQIDGTRDAFVASSVRDALERLPSDTVLAIDIPIGLPKAGDRPCCKAARALLQSRRGSVFPVPVRACLDARTHEEAKGQHYQTDGRKISAQAWAILPKIREVDELLQSSPGFRQRIYEMHPEVSFCRWQGEPMKHPKKKVLGYIEREILIDGAWPGDRLRLFEKVRKQASRDDLNDAFAGLWTAGRICDGTAVQLRSPEDDQSGLPMRIVS